jgi:hypothetical protein
MSGADPQNGAGQDPTATLAEARWMAVSGVLTLRLVGFAVCQALIALALVATGQADAWSASAPWWPLAATATNVATFLVVRALLHREGRRYREFFALSTQHLRTDLLVVVGIALLAAILVLVPTLAIAAVLYGDPGTPAETLIQPIPRWAGLMTLALFPVSIAATELPAYFGYARPRLEELSGHAWLAVGMTAGFLALQHATLPLIFDARFAAWRATSYLPLALVFALTLRWRPRLLPLLVVLHGLADLQAAILVLGSSR